MGHKTKQKVTTTLNAARAVTCSVTVSQHSPSHSGQSRAASQNPNTVPHTLASHVQRHRIPPQSLTLWPVTCSVTVSHHSPSHSGQSRAASQYPTTVPHTLASHVQRHSIPPQSLTLWSVTFSFTISYHSPSHSGQSRAASQYPTTVPHTGQSRATSQYPTTVPHTLVSHVQLHRIPPQSLTLWPVTCSVIVSHHSPSHSGTIFPAE